jgi:MscS family membrane protein
VTTKTLITGLILGALLLPQRVDAQSAPPERPQTTDQNQEVDDPLGRGTPHGTAVGFIRAAEQAHLDQAAEYLESALRPADRLELAQKLGVVLDRKLLTNLDRLSREPGGDLTDGQTSRDRIGVVESASGDVEIFLNRVERGPGNLVWLFSSATLQQIPRLYEEIEPLWIEGYVPEWLRTTRWLSIALYRWIAILLVIPLIFGLAAVFTRVLSMWLGPWLGRLSPQHEEYRLASAGPLRLLVLAATFYVGSFLGLTLSTRQFWERVALTLMIIALCWLSLRLADVVEAMSLRRLQRVQRSGDVALVRLINRLLKAATVVVACLFLLYLADVDLTAALTGLGVGGLAVGFGAQKTIENLFGGIMVISDKPVNIGDVCKVGEYFGTVEDIGIRSTRIRTLERTVVSVPNGQLAAMVLENFAQRDRIRFHHIIGLGRETTADQVRDVLVRIRRMLDAHPKVEAVSSRTRFIKYSGVSLDLEIFAYVLESDHAAFLAIQEDLLLAVMDIIDKSGTSLAVPVPYSPLVTAQ